MIWHYIKSLFCDLRRRLLGPRLRPFSKRELAQLDWAINRRVVK